MRGRTRTGIIQSAGAPSSFTHHATPQQSFDQYSQKQQRGQRPRRGVMVGLPSARCRPVVGQGHAGAATNKAVDGKSVIYIREVPEGGGHVLVVKATQTGEGLWVTSYRRLHHKDAVRDSEIRRLLKKDGK